VPPIRSIVNSRLSTSSPVYLTIPDVADHTGSLLASDLPDYHELADLFADIFGVDVKDIDTAGGELVVFGPEIPPLVTAELIGLG
jgi:hypothetical protein